MKRTWPGDNGLAFVHSNTLVFLSLPGCPGNWRNARTILAVAPPMSLSVTVQKSSSKVRNLPSGGTSYEVRRYEGTFIRTSYLRRRYLRNYLTRGCFALFVDVTTCRRDAHSHTRARARPDVVGMSSV